MSANGSAESVKAERHLTAFEVWRLPIDFFSLPEDKQWQAIRQVTVPARQRTEPGEPCKLTLLEDVAAVAFFLLILGVPLLIPGVTLLLAVRAPRYLKCWGLLVAFFASHPIPRYRPWYRRNRLGVILAKYFTMTFLIDLAEDECEFGGTQQVDETPPAAPCVTVACPHGVLNFGAIVWVFFSRWICGLEQYTAGASAVAWVPGLRYMAATLWMVPVDRKSLKKCLQEPVRFKDAKGNRLGTAVPRRGGMVGIVPDGIAGIFRSKPGEDVLFIGQRRGLMRICLEEGALIMSGWFTGTTDYFRVVTDPLGVMEWLSRKLKVSLFYFYGRWGLPIPRRVPSMMCARVVRAKKTPAPSVEEVENLHQQVYGGLVTNFEFMRHYAGYPGRQLVVQ